MTLRETVSVFLMVLASAAVVPGCGTDHRGASQEGSVTEPPNIVVIMMDTLRRDYLDLHGFPRETAPFLAEMANRGTVFDSAFSTSSWTAPATASALTSLYPTEHGLQIGFFGQRYVQSRERRTRLNAAGATPKAHKTVAERGVMLFQTLSEELETLPELLRSHGYTTTAVATNFNVSETMNFDQGFDHFHQDSLMSAEGVYRYLAKRSRSIQAEAPYFLYVHLMDPHVPYHTRQPHYRRPSTLMDVPREQYLSEIRYMDHYLEKLFDRFGMDEDTIVVFISDHGEEFGDHGGTGHGSTLYGELNDAVMMFYGPSSGVRVQRSQLNVSLIDVVPTVLELAGVVAEESGFSGVSLAPVICSEPGWKDLAGRLGDRYLYAQRVVPDRLEVLEIWAAMRGERKLIVDQRPDHGTELFDLISDPAELNDLSDAEPAVVEELQSALSTFLEDGRIRADVGMQKLDRELEEELEALGYLE